MSWISAYAYEVEPTEFLVNFFEPLVEQLFIDHLVKRFFFIRYWENGPHIRLRILPASLKCEPLVWRRLRQAFDTYALTIQQAGSGLVSVQSKPSLRLVGYAQEVGVFGRGDGMRIAERHFHFSSAVALKVIKALDGRKAKLLRLAALMLWEPLVLMCPGLECVDWLRNYGKFWCLHSGVSFQSIVNMVERQKPALNGSIEPASRGSVRAIWSGEILRVAKEYGSVLPDSFVELNDRNGQSLDMYGRMVHLFNNRLGLVPLEEAYVAAHLIVMEVTTRSYEA